MKKFIYKIKISIPSKVSSESDSIAVFCGGKTSCNWTFIEACTALNKAVLNIDSQGHVQFISATIESIPINKHES